MATAAKRGTIDQLGDVLEVRAEIRQLRKAATEAKAAWSQAKRHLADATDRLEGLMVKLEQRQGQVGSHSRGVRSAGLVGSPRRCGRAVGRTLAATSLRAWYAIVAAISATMAAMMRRRGGPALAANRAWIKSW